MYRKQVFHHLLLAEQDSVDGFGKKLGLEDCSYMLADTWETFTEDNLQYRLKKLWSIEEEQIEESPMKTHGWKKMFYVKLYHYWS